jgi:hypothetical protein
VINLLVAFDSDGARRRRSMRKLAHAGCAAMANSVFALCMGLGHYVFDGPG